MNIHTNPHQSTPASAGEVPSTEQRLALVEDTLAKMLPAVGEMLLALAQHQAVIDKLVDVPVHVAEAMKALAEDQSKVNLGLRLKLDMQAGLITDLQETVEDLREATDSDFLLDDTTADEDSVIFDIETNGLDFGSGDTTVLNIAVDDGTGPRVLNLSGDASDDEAALREFIQKMIEAEGETIEDALSGIRVTGDFYSIPLPKRPAPGDFAAASEYDDFLTELVEDAEGEGMIDAETARLLTAMVRGQITREEAEVLKPTGTVEGLDECLAEWGQMNENACINIHVDQDLSAGVVKTIAYATGLTAMEQVLFALHAAATSE